MTRIGWSCTRKHRLLAICPISQPMASAASGDVAVECGKKWMVMPRFKAFNAVCTWSGVRASIGIVLLKRHRLYAAAIVPKAHHKPHVTLYNSAQKRGEQ